MRNGNILVIYKSVTGFTREYAEMIAQEIDCTLMDFKKVTAETMSDFDTVIFGGRMHAGMVDGLKSAKELWKQSKPSRFMVFATGATPNEAGNVIEEMWKNNLSAEERKDIPHFYMQSGLRYEKMLLSDKLMMKVFCMMMKRKKDKNEYEKQFEKVIDSSYDISSKEYIMPLVAALKNGSTGFVK